MLVFLLLFFLTSVSRVSAQITSPTSTPSATLSATATPSISASNSIVLSEFMANASPEWVEIRNNSSTAWNLVGWKLRDSTDTTRNIPSTTIPAYSYYVFEISSFLNNDSVDQVRIFDDTNVLVDSTTYSSTSNIYSWSKNSLWCLTIQSKGSGNNSCVDATPTPSPTSTSTPSQTPTPTNTPGPTSTPTITPTRSPTFTPIPTLAPLPTDAPIPTAVIEPTPTSEPEVLGDTSTEQMGISDLIFPTPTAKTTVITKAFTSPSLLATIFIGTGGFLLLIPVVMVKLKQ